MKKFLIITITILIVMTQNISAENIPNLIGMWTGENDTYSELKLEFSSKEQAIEYAKKNKIIYEVSEPKKRKIVKKSYADNFIK